MNAIVQHAEAVPTRREATQVYDPVPVLDSARFEHMQRIAKVIALSSLVPDTLCTEGKADNRQRLPQEIVLANCFLVVNQAVRWGMDPFAVLSCCSLVHGKLTYEGKLVAAVLDAKLGIELDYEYNGKTGDALGIIVKGRLPSGKVREVFGTVGEWKTDGKNSPWPKSPRKMLAYRGAREWARMWAPAIMLGVYTDDELSDLQDNARATRAHVPSQQDQLAAIRQERRLPPPEPPPEDEPEPPKAKPEPAKAKPPEPPAEDEPEPPKAKPEPAKAKPPEPPAEDEAGIDWDAQLTAYDNTISACEAEEELNEAVNAIGAVFVDAPEQIQAEARKLEAAKRAYIARQEEGQ